MDYFKSYKYQAVVLLMIGIFIPLGLSVGAWVVTDALLNLSPTSVLIITLVTSILLVVLASFLLTSIITKPLRTISDVISFAAHSNRNENKPTANLFIGEELVSAQSMLIYDFFSKGDNNETSVNNPAALQNVATSQEQVMPAPPNIVDSLAIPVIGLDANQKIALVNKAAATYIGTTPEELIGKQFYDSFKLSFQGDETFDNWLKNSRNSKVVATRSWERVKHVIDRDNSKQFDMVASFSNQNTSGAETYIAMFDRSKKYNQDDQEIGFVALAVHELRTPLTLMRGYIEVFEDELGPTLSPELTEFMHRMHVSAQQLTSFVNNILNTARIEENQLSLTLRKENISEILNTAIADLELRAKVHGKHIELTIADGLPPVGVDRTSVHEVINNLVDNAIKYSDKSETITVKCRLNEQGVVEISVQDYGIGIPASVMSELFQKYHRSHKSSTHIGGTGLGLYLSKALVTAHGGNLFVRSKEGEGSIFTFTLLPFDSVNDGQQNGEDGIIRGAHGWIKNHSLYRN